MVRIPDADQRRPGEVCMAKHPDWPHECCYAGPCPHRAKSGGIMRCESPAECEYFCDVPDTLSPPNEPPTEKEPNP